MDGRQFPQPKKEKLRKSYINYAIFTISVVGIVPTTILFVQEIF